MMSSTTCQHAIEQDVALDVVQSVWQMIREQLEATRHQIHEAILNYPPPIPACDQHFNYLLEQRTGIAQELRRQKSFAEASLTSQTPGALIGEFVSSSIYVDDATKQKMGSMLNAAR